ncbi:hypothetical protein Gohar_025565 [Gossypium harknessii]|uniref:RNase H type-1 domain-containing protein n=1 Tax=Gossypium harknessii TaxID=34285 RepID=A0A7J9IGK4_9ROSI|nr:hypothetical protein [Gossypium harknessii]
MLSVLTVQLLLRLFSTFFATAFLCLVFGLTCELFGLVSYHMNLYVHEGAIIQTHIIIHKVKTYLLELDTVHAKIPSRQIRVERWQPLNVDSLNINFDAAYCANTRTSCSRIVIWNCLGCVIGSSMVINRNFPSAFVAKAIAYSQAILLGPDLGIPNVIVEGDALTMIWRVLSPAPDNLVLGAYTRDIKCQARPFHHCVFWHVPDVMLCNTPNPSPLLDEGY